MNYSLQHIVNSINETISGSECDIAKYEKLIDVLLSFPIEEISDSESVSKFRDAIGSINSRLHAKFDADCRLFDTANSLECFLSKYSICKVPSFSDYAELFISLLGMEDIIVLNGTLDMKYYDDAIKRDFMSVLGRFLFLFNGHINRNIINENVSYSSIFDRIFTHALRIICRLTWTHEEFPQLRILLLNLFDALAETEKSEVYKLIEETIGESNTSSPRVPEDTYNIVYQTLDKYYCFIESNNNITEIKTNWLYAYIYKKRFGFIFCKKFSRTSSASSLPYKFLAFSQAFKDGAVLQVSNGPKVVLFDAGENKRSSEYVPVQSSAFYNLASGMFE